jgi:hypothetical protein
MLMLARILLIVCAVSLLSGCRREPKGDSAGLPAADTWQAPATTPGAAAQNPHGADPHAGLNMDDPHAGMQVGAPSTVPPLPPPDPSRPIDPKKFVEGKIVATDKTRGFIKEGAILFLSVRPIDGATGEVIGSPLAVDRIDVKTLPVTFRLDESKAMSAGTNFSGDVIIMARVDGDGDAITKVKGDIVGSVQAKIPQGGLTLSLDEILP